MAQDSPQAKYSEQNVLNNVYDQVLKALAVMNVGWDGVQTQYPIGQTMATKITTVGSVTYIGIAAPGTAQATAKWQCQKIDYSTSGTVVITWAGSGAFNQTATDLTTNTYV